MCKNRLAQAGGALPGCVTQAASHTKRRRDHAISNQRRGGHLVKSSTPASHLACRYGSFSGRAFIRSSCACSAARSTLAFSVDGPEMGGLTSG